MTRGEPCPPNAVLVRIDSPGTLAKHEQALAAKVVANAQLANIAPDHASIIAARKAALDRAQAAVVLARRTYERVRQLAKHDNAPQARLIRRSIASMKPSAAWIRRRRPTNRPSTAIRARNADPAASVGKALADIKAIQSIIDQMVVYAPVDSQVYQRNVEPGEFVSPASR